MPTINEQETKPVASQQEFSFKEEADVEFGQLLQENETQIPGHLSVLINNCQLPTEDIKFFGVEKEGEQISGAGVKASAIEKDKGRQVVYFNMNQLVQTGQYTENTVEGVITIDDQEIGRESVNTESAIYLG